MLCNVRLSENKIYLGQPRVASNLFGLALLCTVRLSKTGVTYLGWFKGIICRKVYGQKENTSLEGTVGLRKENEINKVRKHKIYPDDPLVSLKKKKLD